MDHRLLPSLRPLTTLFLIGLMTSTVSANTIFVQGTSGNDVAYVFERASGEFRVVLNGQVFDYDASHTYLYFEGFDGNDTFINATDLDCTGFGDRGNDVLITNGGAAFFQGGEGNDDLYGGPGNDVLGGGQGEDLLIGEAGDDCLEGGRDNDILYGGQGNDDLYGGQGDDRLYGQRDNDWMYGQEGNDRCFGGLGDDMIFGNEGDDILYGESGNDTLYGNEGEDRLGGGSGEDLLCGGSDDDRLFGNSGNDVLLGGSGNDELNGGTGENIEDPNGQCMGQPYRPSGCRCEEVEMAPQAPTLGDPA